MGVDEETLSEYKRRCAEMLRARGWTVDRRGSGTCTHPEKPWTCTISAAMNDERLDRAGP